MHVYMSLIKTLPHRALLWRARIKATGELTCVSGIGIVIGEMNPLVDSALVLLFGVGCHLTPKGVGRAAKGSNVEQNVG